MRTPHPTTLTGWGRCRRAAGLLIESEDLVTATQAANLTRGLGRSYGDSALPVGDQDIIACSVLADRLIDFDPVTGVVRAEAGLSLVDLNRFSLPRRWFVPVSPGTQFVTIGGMVAADVHGKNHHRAGCFGEHVRSIKLRLADGRIIECSDTQEPELFRGTLGGMGLTGHILEVEFALERIPTPWIWSRTERVSNLDTMVDKLRRASEKWQFTVGWIDCLAQGANLGRGKLMMGRWANPGEAPANDPTVRRTCRLPFELPDWVLSPFALKLFNTVYYFWPGQRDGALVHPYAFFYPLDVIESWNLLYGRRGFTQYQCVLPHGDDNGPTRRFMSVLASRRVASFLAVIKEFGSEGKGLLSFPRPGITVSLDIPVRADTESVVAELNEVVADEGGRIYMAKDAFSRSNIFRRMEPRLLAFQTLRGRWDPERRLRSAQSVRLFGEGG